MKGIKILRTKQGLSQQELADILKVKRETISQWERDYSYPRAGYLPKLAKIFKCSINDLF